MAPWQPKPQSSDHPGALRQPLWRSLRSATFGRESGCPNQPWRQGPPAQSLLMEETTARSTRCQCTCCRVSSHASSQELYEGAEGLPGYKRGAQDLGRLHGLPKVTEPREGRAGAPTPSCLPPSPSASGCMPGGPARLDSTPASSLRTRTSPGFSECPQSWGQRTQWMCANAELKSLPSLPSRADYWWPAPLLRLSSGLHLARFPLCQPCREQARGTLSMIISCVTLGKEHLSLKDFSLVHSLILRAPEARGKV